MSGVLANVDLRTQLAGHNRLELLLFRLAGKQLFGINVFKVQEVIQCPHLTSIPDSHSVVRGIANMRGRTITVMDLDRAVGGAGVENPEENFVVVTEYNQYVQGFLVGGVDRIVNMNWSEILPPPQGIGDDNYLTAVTRVEGELVEIIDVEKVLAEVIGWNEEVSQEFIEEAENQDDERKPVVLVADDSSVARNQIKRTLDKLGIECVLAMDGKRALEQLQQWAGDEVDIPLHERIFMVISDIEMPEMDGYTFTTEVRRDPRLENLHILLHTSLSGVFNNAMVEKVGANDFIAKFQPDVLAKTVLNRLKLWRDEKTAC
ncbi:two-component system chemotaxis response regulator CheV [Thiogranum longum]|uniref:Two-component system chemotaxis response regulator CheV n=1 Tax=Thiogranum longum TaxID=1537524 RepID=A0A4R1HE05_9GAMM|nr:chemotaxis protein CheV [Thiogranum longum]TCK18873.1 two-component system chemotaxis response regulator CheV [Thiogranum longum]